MPPFNPEQFKDATRKAWDQSAAGWNRNTPVLHAWLADATAQLLDAAGIASGMRVIDIAAGTGDQTLDLARRVGADGLVLATDLSPAILQFAQDNARQAGLLQVQTRVCDAESLASMLDANAPGFDAAVCRLGLMLCPSPLRALQQMRQVLAPGGRAAVLVFSEPAHNPCIGLLMSTALHHAGLAPRDPFQPGSLLSLGKPGLLEALFTEAGFGAVASRRIAAPFRLPSAHAYLEFVRSSASPIVQVLAQLSLHDQEAAWASMESSLRAFQTPGGWEGPNELLLVHGACPA